MWYVPCTTHEREDEMLEDYETAVDLNVNNDEPVDTKTYWKGPRKAWLKVTGD